MRRRPTSHSPFSLFQFLDTLVCTMGALILLLLSMTPRIRHEALERLQARRTVEAPTQTAAPESQTEPDEPVEEPAPSQSAEPEPEPAMAAEPVPWPPPSRGPTEEELAAELARRRAAWLARLDDARAERDRRRSALRSRTTAVKAVAQRVTELQEQSRELEERAASAREALQAVASNEKAVEEQGAQLVEQIAMTRRNIDLLQRKQATAPNEYALVPYEGTSGTQRRPIYIECTSHGFRFLPEGVLIGSGELEGFHSRYNPLLTGAQALMKYWSQRRRSGEPEPYVLLIVRPSGAFAYYLAREFLSSMGASFGYELVEEDWKLSVPPPDPDARAALRSAIDVALEARETIRDAAAARRGTGGRGDGSVSGIGGGRGGGFTPGGADNRFGGGNGRMGDRFAGAEGTEHRDGASGLAGDGRRATGRGGRPPGGGANGAADGTSRSGGGAGEPGPDGALGGPGGEEGSGPGRSGRGASGGAPRTAHRGGPRPARLDGRPGGDDESDDGSFGETPRTMPSYGGARPMPGAGQGDSDGDAESGPSGRSTARSGNRGTSSPEGQGGESDASEPGQMPLPNMLPMARGKTGRIASEDQGPEPGRLKALEPERDAGTDPSIPRIPEGDDSGNEGTFARPGSRGDGRGGRHVMAWERHRKRGSIGLERKVDIRVLPDRILIGPEDATLTVSKGEKSEDFVRNMLAGIERISETWGAPPANFYWIPSVRFVVHPGGNANYERLRGPLQKWGINSAVKYEMSGQPPGAAGGGRR